MLRSLFICAVVLGFAPAVAEASDWKEVAAGSDSVISVDVQSLRFKGNRVKVWERWNFDAPQESASGMFQSAKTLQLYDCIGRSSQMLLEVLYSGENGEGQPIKSTSNSEAAAAANLQEITPDSVAEEVLNFACKRRPKKK